MNNEVLFRFVSTGASEKTAAQDGLAFAGVPASDKMADTDKVRIRHYRQRFEAAAEQHDLCAPLLAAVASRETRGGGVLDPNGWGDGGNAFGLMQVDKRHHSVQGTHDPGSQEHIDQATGILRTYFNQIKSKHPDWPEERQLQGAVAAYNSGVGNVQTLGGMDIGTTGDDYSNDVWARARFYANAW